MKRKHIAPQREMSFANEPFALKVEQGIDWQKRQDEESKRKEDRRECEKQQTELL